MHRRDVLKLAGAAALGGSSCATLLLPPADASDGEVLGFLGRLETALAGIASGDGLMSLLPDESQALREAPRVQQAAALIKKTFRSILLVGSVHDLSEEQRAHPAVQQKLQDSMGEFDEAMLGMTGVLEGWSKTERSDISRALREDPELGMRIMGAIDAEAGAVGISATRRVHLRSISARVCGRLRQSPDLLVDEYLTKVNKVIARHGGQAEGQRRAATALGEQLLWARQDVLSAVEGQATGGSAPAPTAPPLVPAPEPPRPGPRPVPVEPESDRPRVNPGAVVLSIGGSLLGLGVIGFILGLSTGGGGVGLFLDTLGVVLGILGVIGLIVGLILFLAMNR